MKDCRECTSGDRQVFIIIITCYWSLSFPSKREKKKNHVNDSAAYSNSNNNNERFQVKLDQGLRDLP